MSSETFKKCVYIVLFILIVVFFTKDINFFNNDSYKDIKIIDNPNDILVLVNKKNQLPKDFIPKELILLNEKYAIKDKYLRKEAALAFENLSRDASILGYKIIATSTYRNYDYQAELYNYYVQEKGQAYADSCSARPGHSEHQTGLTVDVMGSNNDYDKFEDSDEFEWMKNNAHLYGFIMRYPKNKTQETGFKYEPWHYRYVGVNVAKTIYSEDLVLEEYLDKYGQIKKDN